MSQIDDAKSNAQRIRKGLRQMGADRAVALSVHKTRELIAELEKQADELLEQLEKIS
jgi:hypothetical protein